jgi:hypothetical protein
MQPTVGQSVYLVPGTNANRYEKGKIIEGVIKTIGRKYYTVTVKGCNYQFDKENLQQNTIYTPDYFLYFDKQDIINRREIRKLTAIIRKAHGTYGAPPDLTLDQLRRIKAILDEGNLSRE